MIEKYNIKKPSLPRLQSGVVVLAAAISILFVMIIVSLFMANSIIGETRIMSNELRAAQAFQAAQGGLAYGQTYLNKHKFSITDGQVVNGSLPDGSTFSVTYNYVGGSNDQISMVAVGTSADGSSTRAVRQLLERNNAGVGLLDHAFRGGGAVVMSGNSVFYNGDGWISTMLASTLTINDTSYTYASYGGYSDAIVGISGDVVQNDMTLISETPLQSQNSLLGAPITSFKDLADYKYIDDATSFLAMDAQLNGRQGEIIYIRLFNGSGTISLYGGGTSMGSPTTPVSIFVEGNVSIGADTIIHGTVAATGYIDVHTSAQVNGLVYSQTNSCYNSGTVGAPVVVCGAFYCGTYSTAGGEMYIFWDPYHLQNAYIAMAYYLKVPGGWEDLGSG